MDSEYRGKTRRSTVLSLPLVATTCQYSWVTPIIRSVFLVQVHNKPNSREPVQQDERTASLDRLTNYNLLNSDDNAVHVSVMDAISKTYILVKDKISHEYKPVHSLCGDYTEASNVSI